LKRCLKCCETYQSRVFSCPNCGWRPSIRNKIPIYSNNVTNKDNLEGFDEDAYQGLSEVESGNFWFEARNKLILWAIKKYKNNFSSLLEIGCGTGYVLSGIAQFMPGRKLYGSDLFSKGLEFASKKNSDIQLMEIDARDIPYAKEFDIIGAFDVLEHIEEDMLVLRQIRDALNDNGFLFITVPQHKWLWSSIDQQACHVRRYAASELQSKIEKSGFELVYSTSFVSILLPLMYVSRLFSSKKSNAMNEFLLPSFINTVLYKIMVFELLLIKYGVCFPFGGSRLLVAKKTDNCM